MKKVLTLTGALICAALLASPAAEAQTPRASADVRGKLAALEGEPTVIEVQQAALRYFRVNRDQVNSMRRGAAWKAILPVTEVSGGVARSDIDEDTVNQEFDPNGPWILRASGGKSVEMRGKLTWNLPGLIFNAEELDVASLAGLMEGILKESTRLYFMRRRLQVDMILNPPSDQATLLSKQLRLDELTGLIDAMTGGFLTTEIERRARTTRVKPTGAPSGS